MADDLKKYIARSIVDRVLDAGAEAVGRIVKEGFTPHYEKITDYAFLGKDNIWKVSKGEPKPGLAKAVIGLCISNGVSSGWIARREEDGRRWTDFSPSISPSLQQRISNAIQSFE